MNDSTRFSLIYAMMRVINKKIISQLCIIIAIATSNVTMAEEEMGLFDRIQSKPIHDIEELKKSQKKQRIRKRRQSFHYHYFDREHTRKENLKLIGAVYGVSWVLYPLTQPSVFRNKGSIDNYKKNFGRLVFDQDEPFWNWFVHPLSGSQMFLFYRANGYSRISSLAMSFVNSTLFEFTAEVYTEPASIQDLYQTPILGSILGVGLETLSLYLLNTGNMVGRFFGHVFNPYTLFWFYEGKIKIVPYFKNKKTPGLFVMGTF